MKILYVYPSRLDENDKVIKYKKAFLPPLALAILNRLTPEHHEVKVINDIVEEIDFSNTYDLVAITAMTTQITRAYQIADRFRDLGSKVIIGGIHTSILPDEAKEHADSVVIGEVENIWEYILNDFENNHFQDFYHEKEFPDLQKLIIPKWDNFNLRIYPKPLTQRLPLMPIYTTRGCIYNCKFCSVSKFFGRTHRLKPVGNVMKEIDEVNAKDYFFVDDNIVCNPDYSRELFQALSKKNIRWMSQVSTTLLKNPELIDLAAKAGGNYLFIGIESLQSNNLKSIRKGFNNIEEYEELFARIRKAGIVPLPSIIIGLDNDTKEQLEMTIDFVLKNKTGNVFLFILTPLPGTDLYREMEDEGRILERNWSLYDLNHVVFQPKNFTPRELNEIYWKLYQKCFSVKKMVQRLYNWISISPHPVNEFFKAVYYQSYFRRKIAFHEHPLSGGINKILSN